MVSPVMPKHKPVMFENKITIPLTISNQKVELIISGEPSQERNCCRKI